MIKLIKKIKKWLEETEKDWNEWAERNHIELQDYCEKLGNNSLIGLKKTGKSAGKDK